MGFISALEVLFLACHTLMNNEPLNSTFKLIARLSNNIQVVQT
jgi:hypothetical protein